MSKTWTKAEIIKKVAEETGFQRKEAYKAVESLLEVMKDTLASGEAILVSGFGKFTVRQKNKRLGRNPETGESMILDERRVVTFKCSKQLREKMNK